MSDDKRLTITSLCALKRQGTPIACLTAYDATFGELCDAAGVDMILVGDSLGMVVQGRENTIAVSVDDMVYHSRCVVRAVQRAFVIADMPFMSATTPAAALENAARLMREAGVSAVKLEVGARQLDAIGALAENGVPVCAHLGLRPQWVHEIGGFKRQVRSSAEKRALVELADEAVARGARMLLLECVPADVADEISERVEAPVIGIGVDSQCDGQIMVIYDILGAGRTPLFAKNFLSGASSIGGAIQAYVKAVKRGRFP